MQRIRRDFLCSDVTHQNIIPYSTLSDCHICLACDCRRGWRGEKCKTVRRRKRDLMKVKLITFRP